MAFTLLEAAIEALFGANRRGTELSKPQRLVAR